MADCNAERIGFAPLKGRAVEAAFKGDEVSSDCSALLLRKVDRRLGLLKVVARALADPRDPERVTHWLANLVKQRVFGSCLGYDDLNDQAMLRADPLMQTACEGDTAPASTPAYGEPLFSTWQGPGAVSYSSAFGSSDPEWGPSFT